MSSNHLQINSHDNHRNQHSCLWYFNSSSTIFFTVLVCVVVGTIGTTISQVLQFYHMVLAHDYQTHNAVHTI